MVSIEIILAVDNKYGIAANGDIPWKIKEDLQHFKNITSEKINEFDNVIIMGKNTALTLNKSLPNRKNIVMTKSLTEKELNEETDSQFIVYNYLTTLLDELQNNKQIGKIFVIGGESLVNDFMSPKLIKLVSKIHLTYINEDYTCDKFVRCLNFKSESNIWNSYFELTKIDKKIHKCFRLNKEIDVEYLGYSNKYFNYDNTEEINYLNIAKNIIETGHKRETRNATTISKFAKQLEFDLSNGFPLLTTKKMFLRGIIEELIFFLCGKTNCLELKEKNVNIWNGNTTKEFIQKTGLNLEEGDMGPMYGFQWRHFNAHYTGCSNDYTGKGFDQLEEVVDLLIKDPYSRRILMTTYNPSQSKEGVLYPCHGLTVQFYIENINNTELLSCQMYQRSADWFLGVPFNIASYAALLLIIQNLVNNKGNKNYGLGKLYLVFGDVHVYFDHIEQIKEQLSRINNTLKFPQLKLNKELKSLTDLNDLKFSDFKLENYISHQAISGSMIA